MRFMLFYSNLVRLFSNSERRIYIYIYSVCIAVRADCVCSFIRCVTIKLLVRVSVSFHMKTQNDTMHSIITSNTRKDTNL